MKLDMQRIWKRNLGIDDRCIADSGKEARFPFLDEDVIKMLLDIPLWEITGLNQQSGIGDKKILREIQEKEPNLSELEIVEKCFGAQKKGKVTCFGGGIKPKHLKVSKKSARGIALEKENARLRAEKVEEADYWKKEFLAFKEKIFAKMPDIMDDDEDDEEDE